MTPADLYAAMDIPDTCLLGHRIFKKLFYENAPLTAADKRALSKDVDTIAWQYTLKPSTLPIPAYEDGDREYLEIAIIEAALNTRRSATRIAEVVHRSIPYPLVVVLSNGGAAALSVAHKRMSRAERGAVVAEGFLSTPWLEGSQRSSAEIGFLSSLRLRSLPQTHFLALYSSLARRVLALLAAAITGRFALPEETSEAERRRALDRCRGLSREIHETRVAIRRELSFARQIELNSKLKRLEQEHALEAEKL